MRRQGVIVVVLVGVISFLSGGWLLQRGGAQSGSVYQKARLFDDILAHVADYYVDSLDERKLYDLAIDGMLGELNDPYTTFLREKEYRDLTLNTTGNYAGLGIQIGIRDGWVTVVAPIADTPAERAGIASGDRILEVDGQSTYGWKDDQAVRTLRGEAGTKAQLKVARPGVDQPLEFSITRAKIHVKSVQFGTVLGSGVGYVSLTNVSETSPQELSSEIVRLKGAGAKSIVLDLRGNPGGLLDQGVSVADMFLDPGQDVVQTRGRGPGATRTYDDSETQKWPDMPIVALVDVGTASAAEIIAGALQDHDRAVIVGTPTYGKGLVQTLFVLSSTEALKITTARWFTPSGRSIQRPQSKEAIAAEADGDSVPKPGKADSIRAAADTVTYKTDGGRTIRGGGGGIYPDILVKADTLTDAERGFVKALGGKIPAYRDVLTGYAVELKAKNAVPDQGFQVTPAMRQELLRRLRERKVEITDSLWSGVRSLIDQQFGYEVAHYVFGREAEFRRRAADDADVQKALDLLKRARTPKDLIGLANSSGETSAAVAPGAKARQP